MRASCMRAIVPGHGVREMSSGAINESSTTGEEGGRRGTGGGGGHSGGGGGGGGGVEPMSSH